MATRIGLSPRETRPIEQPPVVEPEPLAAPAPPDEPASGMGAPTTHFPVDTSQ